MLMLTRWAWLVVAAGQPPPPGMPHGRSPDHVRGGKLSVPRLTAKVTAKLHDTRDPQGMTMDAHIRSELRRCGRRWPAEQLTSPMVEGIQWHRTAKRRMASGIVLLNHLPRVDWDRSPIA